MIVLICIDSGTGTTKLMAQFLRSKGGKYLKDVILIAKGCSHKESFDSFERLFNEVAEEIKLIDEGLMIGDKNVDVSIVYNCDFMALYAMSGIPSAVFSHPFPYCTVHV